MYIQVIPMIQMMYNKNRLELFSRLFEESPVWFCSHLLAMIQLVRIIQQYL